MGGGLLWWGGVRGSSESMYRKFFFQWGGGVLVEFCVRRWGWAAGSTADDVLGVSTN